MWPCKRKTLAPIHTYTTVFEGAPALDGKFRDIKTGIVQYSNDKFGFWIGMIVNSNPYRVIPEQVYTDEATARENARVLYQTQQEIIANQHASLLASLDDRSN